MLAPRLWDDKSKWLAQVGFTLPHADQLELAIRQLITRADAVEDGINDYGTFYRATGSLEGPTGLSLQVAVIWLQWKLDGTFRFVTLKPHRVQP